jgi:hypothetical protein
MLEHAGRREWLWAVCGHADQHWYPWLWVSQGGATRELLTKFKGSIKRELLLKAGVHLSAAGIDRTAQRPLGVGGTLAVARDLALLVSDLVSDLWCLDLTLIAFTSLYVTEAVLLVDIGQTLGRLGDLVLSLVSGWRLCVWPCIVHFLPPVRWWWRCARGAVPGEWRGC